MLYQLLKRNQVSLAIGSLPSPFVSKVADISEAIEHALEFCLNEIIPGADCPVCPHVAFIDTLNTFGSISELTAKVLNRYGINAIFSPGVHPVKRSWALSEKESLYFESATEVKSLESLKDAS